MSNISGNKYISLDDGLILIGLNLTKDHAKKLMNSWLKKNWKEGFNEYNGLDIEPIYKLVKTQNSYLDFYYEWTSEPLKENQLPFGWVFVI